MTQEPRGFAEHNHTHCVTDGLATAEARCADQGLQLTPVRKRVLELLLHEHRAMGAYDILDHLRAEGLGSQPPIAYRALDFLVKNHFAHRIERLNAFVACSHPDHDHAPAFLICRECNAVAEADGARTALSDTAKALGFTIENRVIEFEGLCPNCQKAPA